MNKFNDFMTKWGNVVICVLLILTLSKSCGTSNDVTRVKKAVAEVSAKCDTISNTTITADEMKELIGLKDYIQGQDKTNATLKASNDAKDKTINGQQATINRQQTTINTLKNNK